MTLVQLLRPPPPPPPQGRIFAVFFMLAGVGTFALCAGKIASIFIEKEQECASDLGSLFRFNT